MSDYPYTYDCEPCGTEHELKAYDDYHPDYRNDGRVLTLCPSRGTISVPHPAP
jgi:hypothetical protein